MHVPEGFAVVAPYVFVDGADSYAEHIMDIANMPYGDRQGGVRDPAGNIWWVSQRLSDKPYF